MRDPKRIDRMLDLLRAYWTAAPDLRLGQIVGNFTPRHTYTVQDEMGEYPTERPGDSYYVEDDVIEAALSKALAARPAPERAEPAGSDEVRPCDACMVPCEERGPILPSCPPVLAPIIAPDSCDECQVPQDARHPCPPCSTPSPPHIPGVCDADLHPLCPLCGARVTSTFGCLTCKGLPSGFGPFIPHEHDPPLAAPLSVLPSCDSPFVSAIPSRDSPFIDAFAPAGDGVNSDGNSYSLPPGVTLTPSFPSVFAEEPLAPPLAAPIPAQEMRETFWKVEAVRGGGYGAVVCDDKGEILRYANGNPRDLTPTYHVGDGAEAAARADGAASGLPEFVSPAHCADPLAPLRAAGVLEWAERRE